MCFMTSLHTIFMPAEAGGLSCARAHTLFFFPSKTGATSVRVKRCFWFLRMTQLNGSRGRGQMGSVRLKQALSAWSKLAAMQRIPLGFAQCKKILKNDSDRARQSARSD